MKNTIDQFRPKSYARIVGVLYLMIAVCGGFSMGYLPTIIVESGNALSTAQNVAAHSGLLQFGLLADIAVFLMEVVVSVMLYKLLRSVSETLALASSLARFAMSVVMGLNVINYLIPLLLLSGASFLNVFELDQLQALALIFLEAHGYAVYIWGLFFGLHLLILGYLVIKAEYFPKLLGVLMLVGSLGYIVEAIAKLVLTDSSALSFVYITLLVIVVIGELSFTFWLLIKGLNEQKWNETVV